MAIEVPVGWAGISRDQLLLRNYWLSHLEKPPSCSTELQYNALQGGWWRWWHPICVIYMCNKGQVGWEAHRFIHMDPCISATHHILLVEVEQFWWTACLCICAYLHLCIFAFVHICICAYLHTLYLSRFKAMGVRNVHPKKTLVIPTLNCWRNFC